MIRFGKPSEFLIDLKKDLFLQNDAKLEEIKQVAQLYRTQPRRTKCKMCTEQLGSVTFRKLGIQYITCGRCGHLNGAHEDTEEFCAALYTRDGGKSYAQTYYSENEEAFYERVRHIYLPKALFLTDALSEINEDPKYLSFADIGAGSGYFVSALLQSGMDDVVGYEVSKSQVEFGNSMLKTDLLKQHSLSDVMAICANLESDVVTLIGVLEHLRKPRELLAALRNNDSVHYLFFSVPLFSPCVFFEMVFPEVAPRHLVAGHTHLYTKDSIDHFCQEFGLEKVAEWWFGSDVMDLYRSVAVMLDHLPETGSMFERWKNVFQPLIDDIQMEIDKRRASSEVHMLVQVKR